MNESEITKEEVQATYDALIKMLEKISSKKYLDAIEKLANICVKQNPNLN
jgi:hypothetical protein